MTLNPFHLQVWVEARVVPCFLFMVLVCDELRRDIDDVTVSLNKEHGSRSISDTSTQERPFALRRVLIKFFLSPLYEVATAVSGFPVISDFYPH